MKTKIAVVGTGHLGSIHVKVLKEIPDLVEITGIYDTNPEQAKNVSEKFNVKVFKTLEEIPSCVDAVNLCVPTESHYETGKFFLEQGVHTFIEKPISSTVAQADELTALAEKKKLTLQIGHVERFNSAFESAKHFMTKPLFIECHRMNHFPNRSLDIGVVMDLMIHDIDIILGLNHTPVKDVQATGINVLTDKEDIASTRITFESGCVANLTASRISEDVMRKIRIFQNNSYLSLDYVKQEAFIYKKYGSRILKHSLPIEKEQPLKRELEHFADCVTNRKKPLIAGQEGRDALQVATIIEEKIWQNLQNT